ncbi:MAG: hypothetical protein QM604_12150 [Microbacterium sp.]
MSVRPPLHRPAEMGDGDAELLEAARRLLADAYEPDRHEVASAFRLGDGELVTGLHVDGSARRSAVCAEGVAAGNAFAHAAGKPFEVVSIVSVLRRADGAEHVIEPCGVCAEMLGDYWPDAVVWVTSGDRIQPTTVAALLPARRRHW